MDRGCVREAEALREGGEGYVKATITHSLWLCVKPKTKASRSICCCGTMWPRQLGELVAAVCGDSAACRQAAPRVLTAAVSFGAQGV